MELMERQTPELAGEAITEQSIPFEYPSDGVEAEQTKADLAPASIKAREFLVSFISMNPYDFIIFQQRVLYRRNAREIGAFPLLPGRMAVVAKCRKLANKFPMFKKELLAGFDRAELSCQAEDDS